MWDDASVAGKTKAPTSPLVNARGGGRDETDSDREASVR